MIVNYLKSWVDKAPSVSIRLRAALQGGSEPDGHYFFSTYLDRKFNIPTVGYDFGANFGVYAYSMAKYCGHVHAIEPNPTAYKFLSRWAEGHNDITSYNRAVWSEICELELKEPIINGITRHRLSTTSTNFLELKNIEDWHTFKVQTLRLEDIGFANPAHLTIFKCDVEGAESNIFDSLKNGFESGAIGMIEVSRKNNSEHHEFLLEVGKIADIFVVSDGCQALERISESNIAQVPEDIFNYFCFSKKGDLWERFTTFTL